MLMSITLPSSAITVIDTTWKVSSGEKVTFPMVPSVLTDRAVWHCSFKVVLR